MILVLTNQDELMQKLDSFVQLFDQFLEHHQRNNGTIRKKKVISTMRKFI